MLVLGLAIVISGGVGLFETRGTATDGTAVVTVVEAARGYRGRLQGLYEHRVRFSDGRERLVTLYEILQSGSRLKLTYREYVTSNKLEVVLYAVCGNDVPC